MTREEAIEKLKELQYIKDPVGDHIEGDLILCKFLINLGYEDVVNEWHKIEKWYT